MKLPQIKIDTDNPFEAVADERSWWVCSCGYYHESGCRVWWTNRAAVLVLVGLIGVLGLLLCAVIASLFGI